MLTGDVNGVKGGMAFGWAWDPDHPSKHVEVEVSADTGHSQVIAANNVRTDLVNARKGNGDHAFSFKVPSEWLTRVPTTLTFRFAETGQLLPRGTVAVTPRLPLAVTDDKDLFAGARDAIANQEMPEVKISVAVNAAYALTLKVRDLQSSIFAKVALTGPLNLVVASGRTRIDKHLEFRDIGRDGDLRILEGTFKVVAKTDNATDQDAGEADIADLPGPFPTERNSTSITLTFGARVPDALASGAEPNAGCEFVSPALLRQIAPELVTPFETGAASADTPQASFATMAPVDEHGRETSVQPRAPRIAAIADTELAGALARCAYVHHLTGEPEDSLWQARFDLVLLQMSHLHTVMIRNAHARESVSRCMDLCVQLQIPIVAYLDAPEDGLLASLGLDAGVAFALYEQPQVRAAGNLPARHELSVAPPIDTALYNPFGDRDRRAPFADFGGNGLYVADGWWDLSRAAWDIADSVEPMLPRLVVMDSRYDVSVLRVQKESMFRWNTLGTVDEKTKLDVLKRCSFAVFADSGGGPSANLPRAMVEAKACGCLPVILDSATSGDQTWQTAALGAVRLSELESFSALKKDVMLYRSVLETLRTCDPSPLLSRITGKLYPDRAFSYREAKPHVSVITVSMRPWNIENILANFKRQNYEYKDHIVIIHGSFSEEQRQSIETAVSHEERTTVYFCPPQITLGECLNYGTRRAGGQFIAKFDDDDHYTEDYLLDAIFLIETAGATMYTQPSGLVYLADSQSLIRYRPGVNASFAVHDARSYPGFTGAGGTLIIAKQLVETIAFSETRRGGIDSDFVGRAIAAGETLHVGAYFNYVFFRHADKAGHTWRMQDDEFTANADVLASGQSLPDCLLETGLTAGPKASSAVSIPA